MPRDQGFAVADVDTGLHTDPKVRLLWRIVHKSSAMNAAMTLYEAVRLASWDAGERISAGDAAPFWFGDVEAPQKTLTEAGLLDKEGRIPAHAWEGWFGPANERREKRREAGKLGGRPPKPNESDAEPPDNHLVSNGMTADNPVPSVPSVPSHPSAPSVNAPAGAAKHGSKNLDEERDGLVRRLKDEQLKPDIVNAIYARIAQIDNLKAAN